MHSSLTELETRITNATSVTDELLQELTTELARLVKSLTDATGSIPRYDQRRYEERLKTLQVSLSQLRTLSNPKPKFTFKRKPATPTAVPVGVTRSPVSTPVPTTRLSLSNHSRKLLTAESLPKSTSPEDLAIHDLDHCIVNLIPSSQDSPSQNQSPPLQIQALHIQGLNDTVLLLPPVEGSVLIHNLTRCTIVVGCHQFRMHRTTNVDVYLAVTSDPVIEDCSGIRFGGYPNTLGPSPNTSKHSNVLDFSHIRSSPSPNWSDLGYDRVSNQWPLGMPMTAEVLDTTRERILPE